MSLSIERINKAREAGFDDDTIVDAIQQRDSEFGKRISKARESGYDSKTIIEAIQNKLNTPLNTPVEKENTPDETPKQRDLIKSFESGLQQSASGELGKAVFDNKTQEQLVQDPDFWEQVSHSGGTIAGDFPYMLIGGTVGAALGGAAGSVVPGLGTGIGGAVGGAFGSLALPTFIKEALKEYREHNSKGNDLTFGEFLQQADRVASKTLREGAFGVILGSISKAVPMLAEIPGVGKLFSSKPAQKAASIGAETLAAGTIPALTEGRLPTANDYGQALAVVLGFNVARLPATIKRRIEDSGKTPERYLKDMPQEEIIELAKQLERPDETNQKTNESGEVPVKSKDAEINQTTETPESSKEKSANLSLVQSEMSVKRPKTEKIPDPITETTGQGAAERLEPVPTKMGEIKRKAGEVAESISNPTELANRVYTKSFDALEPLNRLETDIPVEERVTTKIKQAQSAASDINNILTKGIFDNVSNRFESGSLKDVYIDQGEVWQKATKGLKPQDYSLQEMDVYRTSKEALKRQNKGLKSGVDTNIATKDVARLKQKYGPVDQRLRQFQKRTLETYGKDLLGDEIIDQWSQDSHASLYRVMDYGNDAIVKEGSLTPKKPWYKAKGSGRKILPPSESDIQNLSMLVSNAKKNDSILQYKKLVEQGRLPGKIVKSKNKEMPSKMMDDLEIDPENKALAEQLYNQSRKDSFTPENGRIKGWDKGKPFEIEVPQDVFETYSSLSPSDTGTFTKLFRSTNNLMSRGIVLEPRKLLSIVGRDALSSLIYSKTGSNPISIVRALTDIYKDSHSWNQFKSLGGEQYVSRLMTRTDRAEKIEQLIKAERPNAIVVPFKKLGNFLSEFNAKLAASVPFAEYQRSVEKYGDTPNGRLLALINAKEVTYDPTKKGSSKLVKGAANFFPFFNVMLQEPAMIAKNMRRPQFWAKGAVGLTLPSLLLKIYNDGNPDYDDMNPLLKASCWHFYTEDSHYAVPVPWLLGALFKSTPEAFYDMLKNSDPDGFKGLKSYVLSQLSGGFPPIVQAAVEQSTGESLPSPLGLVMMPFTDVEKRAPPVVPKRLQNLPPEQQYTSKTSQLARWYGDLWKVPPVKVERLIKTFTGGLGSDALALIDEIAYQTGLAEDLRPDQGAKNYLLLGNFVSNSTPSYTKYMEQFYSMLEESRLDKQREKPNNYSQLNKSNQQISKLFRQYRDIEESKIDGSVKKDQLIEKQKQINAAYKNAVLKYQK